MTGGGGSGDSDETPATGGSSAATASFPIVRAVFGLESQVITDPTSGKPMMLPLGRHHISSYM